jgi:hypothetical protein
MERICSLTDISAEFAILLIFAFCLMHNYKKPTKACNENFWGTKWRLKWNEENSRNGIVENRASRNPRKALSELVPILADLQTPDLGFEGRGRYSQLRRSAIGTSNSASAFREGGFNDLSFAI